MTAQYLATMFNAGVRTIVKDGAGRRIEHTTTDAIANGRSQASTKEVYEWTVSRDHEAREDMLTIVIKEGNNE